MPSCRMQLFTSYIEGEFGYPMNRFKRPVIFYITDRSKEVLLIWFSVSPFLASFFVLFSPTACVDNI